MAATALGAESGAGPVELELVQAWSVEGPEHFQPSALALRDGAIFTVSDKHSDTIFRIELDGERARCEPAVRFTGPEPLPRHGWLDLEAIAPSPDGGFYLASEEAVRLLHVPAGGGAARWLTPDLVPFGAPAGLLQRHNAYWEGLAVLGDGRFLLAAEREARGLVEVWTEGGELRTRAQSLEQSSHPLRPGRSTDFADLAAWRGRIFALARNQHLVVELVRASDGAWREGPAWSFAATENDPQRCFVDDRFGTTEGLAIDDERIYIVTDNGNMPRASSREDARPWLFAFRHPRSGD